MPGSHNWAVFPQISSAERRNGLMCYGAETRSWFLSAHNGQDFPSLIHCLWHLKTLPIRIVDEGRTTVVHCSLGCASTCQWCALNTVDFLLPTAVRHISISPCGCAITVRPFPSRFCEAGYSASSTFLGLLFNDILVKMEC